MIAFAMEKQTGEFVVGRDGRSWLIPNPNSIAASVLEPDGKARKMGFGPLDESVKLRAAKDPKG
jgi:hypothetical protein